MEPQTSMSASVTKGQDRPSSSVNEDKVLSVLKPEQLVNVRRQRFGKRTLGTGAKVAMWGLRIYAVLMTFIIIFSVFKSSI